MAQLRPRIPELRARGVELHAIGNGSVVQLKWFLEDMGAVDFPAWTDPTREAFKLAGMRHGASATLGLASTLRYGRGLLKGFANKGGVLGDALQLGGAILVRADGRVAYTHVGESVGHHVDLDRALRSL